MAAREARLSRLFWDWRASTTCGDLEQEVQWPSKDLMADQHEQTQHRRIFSKVKQLLDCLLDSTLALSRWHECCVFLHVISIPMMAGVAVLPGIKGHAKKAVQREPKGVVQD